MDIEEERDGCEVGWFLKNKKKKKKKEVKKNNLEICKGEKGWLGKGDVCIPVCWMRTFVIDVGVGGIKENKKYWLVAEAINVKNGIISQYHCQ